LLGGESVNDLVDEGGCVGLFMVAERVGGDDGLTPFYCALSGFEVLFEG
jgi:hypothetical protein